MRRILRYVTCLSLAALLAACGKSPENPAPAVATAPAAASAAAPAVSTAPAPSTVPAAASVPAASTVRAAATVASTAATTPVAAATPAVAPGTAAAPAATSGNGPEIAGSVAVAEGSVTDTAKDGSVRHLKDGDDVYPGDSFVLGDASYLDLDLEDQGRMLLRPNTTFQITSYHFEPDAHAGSGPTDPNGQPLIKPQQPENAFFRLIKGGLRAIDGDIGHTTPQNYGVETPVATIGVRGTAFDVRYCGDDCADEADASGKPENGLYTSVSEGSVGIKNDSGETVTKAGHSGFVRSRRERLQALSTPPKALRHMDLPDRLKARAQNNRSQIQVRRQQRRQRVLERRRKAKAAGKPAPPPKTLQERRQQRGEEQRGGAQQAPADEAERQQQREQRRQQREQQQTAAPGGGKPAAAGQAPAEGKGLTPRERWQQRRQQRQQQREQKQQDQAAQPAVKSEQQPPEKDNKQGAGRCKGKRKKNRGKCG